MSIYSYFIVTITRLQGIPFNAWNPSTIRELNARTANGRNDRNKRPA